MARVAAGVHGALDGDRRWTRSPSPPTGRWIARRCPSRAASARMTASWSAPRTEMERRLAEIWERELDICPIGVTDDFFDLGVTSIVAATLFAAIEHELGDQLPLGAIFRAPTIEALAKLLEGAESGSRWTSLVPIQPEGTKPPIFCIHGGAGTILHLAPLARRLGPDQPFYGLQSRGLYGGSTPLQLRRGDGGVLPLGDAPGLAERPLVSGRLLLWHDRGLRARAASSPPPARRSGWWRCSTVRARPGSSDGTGTAISPPSGPATRGPLRLRARRCSARPG